jgi:hypothetical protein
MFKPTRIAVLSLLFLWAAADRASALNNGYRCVFYLLDSSFAVVSGTESHWMNSEPADTSAIRAKAQSLATWPSGIQLNTAATDGVWMAWEPPADPGDIVFVSDSDPIQPLLVLRIDAMCQRCIHRYDAYGDTAFPRAPGRPLSDPIVSDLDERFGYGMKTSSEEKASVAHALANLGFPPANGPIRIRVLKVNSGFPSIEGITYIAYYVVPATVSEALRPLGRAERHAVSAPKADALGRRVTGKRIPLAGAFVRPAP